MHSTNTLPVTILKTTFTLSMEKINPLKKPTGYQKKPSIQQRTTPILHHRANPPHAVSFIFNRYKVKYF